MVSLLNNGTMRLRNPGLVASDFTNGMSSEKSHQHETHQTSHILGFYSLQRSHRYIHNRSSKSIQSMQTGTSQVKHQTPGLEYSRWRTLRQTSRTVLSCPSLPLSPSLSPAGLIARYKRPPNFAGSIAAVSISSGGFAVVTRPPASSSRQIPAQTSHSQQPCP